LELLVENAWAASFTIKEFKMLFSEVECGMTFDVGHAYTSDGEGMAAYVKEFRKLIKHVHIHDNDKKSDQHLPLGTGKIDIAQAVKDLKSFYDGTITVEVHSQDRNYLKTSREKLEILWYGRERFEGNKDYLFPNKK
jgi:sugar phosphate isomerase/epimerase